jgi:hypothetical protein
MNTGLPDKNTYNPINDFAEDENSQENNIHDG